MVKKALVLGGGGAKGSYQMGVWQALREHEIEFDIIVGTSIGAMNGALIVQNDFALADEVWNSIEYQKIFGDARQDEIKGINSIPDMIKFAVNDASVEGSLDSAPLEKLVKNAVDEKKIRSAKSSFGLVTVEFPIMRPITPMIDEIPEGSLYKYLMASSACFPVFSPYEIDGVRYVDGAYYDNIPINFAMEKGAVDIIAVDVDGVGLIKQPKIYQGVTIKRIFSRWDLGTVFDFDQSVFARNRKLGYLETLKFLGEKDGCYYTFSKGEKGKNLRVLHDRLTPLRDDISSLMRRPMTRAITKVERDGILDMISKVNGKTQASKWLMLVAEAAGIAYKLSPEREYRFREFNEALIERYFEHKDTEALKEELRGAEDIRQAMAMVLEYKESGHMTSALVNMMMQKKYEEPVRLLSALIPREYIAARYVSVLLAKQKGRSSVFE